MAVTVTAPLPFLKSLTSWARAACDGRNTILVGDWRKDAGLPDDCHAHGLRKTFCKVAAEADLTPHQIMAISGHKTLAEVTRYTAQVDRKKIAKSGMKKIESRT